MASQHWPIQTQCTSYVRTVFIGLLGTKVNTYVQFMPLIYIYKDWINTCKRQFGYKSAIIQTNNITHIQTFAYLS